MHHTGPDASKLNPVNNVVSSAESSCRIFDFVKSCWQPAAPGWLNRETALGHATDILEPFLFMGLFQPAQKRSLNH